MAVSEKTIQAEVQMAASQLGARLFRNQVGQYQLADGRWLSSGLCVGSSDLIGWKPVTITQDMVGKTVAQFLAVEVKRPGQKPSIEQRAFIAAVCASGGCAGVVTSQTELRQLFA